MSLQATSWCKAVISLSQYAIGSHKACKDHNKKPLGLSTDRGFGSGSGGTCSSMFWSQLSLRMAMSIRFKLYNISIS